MQNDDIGLSKKILINATVRVFSKNIIFAKKMSVLQESYFFPRTMCMRPFRELVGKLNGEYGLRGGARIFYSRGPTPHALF